MPGSTTTHWPKTNRDVEIGIQPSTEKAIRNMNAKDEWNAAAPTTDLLLSGLVLVLSALTRNAPAAPSLH